MCIFITCSLVKAKGFTVMKVPMIKEMKAGKALSRDGFSSFQKCESSAVVSFSKGHGPFDAAGSNSSISIYADQSSNDNHEVEGASGHKHDNHEVD
ncbi:hypothetical protein TB2_014704 [Malus domestica]